VLLFLLPLVNNALLARASSSTLASSSEAAAAGWALWGASISVAVRLLSLLLSIYICCLCNARGQNVAVVGLLGFVAGIVVMFVLHGKGPVRMVVRRTSASSAAAASATLSTAAATSSSSIKPSTTTTTRVCRVVSLVPLWLTCLRPSPG